MNLEKYFLLSWKKVLIIIIVWVIAVILHNLIYGLFNIEEAVFFLLAVILVPIYFIIAILYTIIHRFRKK